MTEQDDVSGKNKTLWEKASNAVALPTAVIALILAIVQGLAWLKGAETILFSPQQILLVAYKYPGNDNKYLRLSARMAYVNEGQSGYNSIIAGEKVSFSIAGKTYTQIGQSYETFRFKEGSLVSDYHSDAKPLPVIAVSAESHETYFAPKPVVCEDKGAAVDCRPDHNFIEWGRFINIAGEARKIEFNLTGNLHGERAVSKTCGVRIDDHAVRQMALLGYAPLPCLNNGRN